MTFRFIGYFVAFYLILVIGVFGSLIAFFIYLWDNTGTEIQSLDAFEIEDSLLETNEGLKLNEDIIEKAAANNGQLYLLNKHMEVRDYSGQTCSICHMEREELLAIDEQGMHVWKLENGYLLFLQNNHPIKIFEDLFSQWQKSGTISEASKLKMDKENITIDLYDNRWNRIETIGEQRPLIYLADIVASKNDLFERKEHLQAGSLQDGTTFVVRIPNDYYKPFEDPFNKAMAFLVLFFIGFHILLIIGIIIFSLGISKQFVRPIVYILNRIENLARFQYKPKMDPRMHHTKTKQLKRKYKLFQPVEDSLTHLAYRLESNEQQIKQTEQLREEWITGLSHDLKTPLSSIYGYSAMLTSSHEWSPEETKEFAQTIQDKATYMDALIQDLTYTYQLKNKAVVPNFQVLNLSKWLEQFSDRNVTVNHAENIFVKADALLLQRAIENIVSNAIKHTPNGTAITITALQNDKNTLIKISDNGPGIPNAELNNLFNRYYRGTNTREDTNGTGLGLAIAKQLIELHNGQIRVSSNNHGTVFTIQLLI